MSSSASPITSRTEISLFDPKTGIVSKKLRQQLDLIGYVGEGRIRDVKTYLQHKYFQKDLYQIPSGELGLQLGEARAFLDDYYANRQETMPRTYLRVDALFPCGREISLLQRFFSFQRSLMEGFEYGTVHLIVADDPTKLKVAEFFEARREHLPSGMTLNFVVTNTETDIFKTGLRRLSSDPSLAKEYVIISNPSCRKNGKIERDVSSILQDRVCLGIVSSPLRDWHEEMNLYEYETRAGSVEKATIAWAYSRLNQISRDVTAKVKQYDYLMGPRHRKW